jgi:exonuclease III
MRKGYSGTAIFTKIKPISVKFDMEIPAHIGEGRLITTVFESFVLVGTYVPNSGDGLKRLDYRVNDWDVDMHKFIASLEKEH